MLYNEFIEGTGCKDNKHNYKVYKDLEIMYMNSDMTKAEIYEYGKKLVDNSKTEEQIRIDNEMKDKIDMCKRDIGWYKAEIDRYKYYLENCTNTDHEKRSFKDSIKAYREQIRKLRHEIEMAKWVMM